VKIVTDLIANFIQCDEVDGLSLVNQPFSSRYKSLSWWHFMTWYI